MQELKIGNRKVVFHDETMGIFIEAPVEEEKINVGINEGLNYIKVSNLIVYTEMKFDSEMANGEIIIFTEDKNYYHILKKEVKELVTYILTRERKRSEGMRVPMDPIERLANIDSFTFIETEPDLSEFGMLSNLVQ